MRIRTAVSVAFVAFLIGGCTSPSESASTTPTPELTSTVTPSPSTPPPPPDPAPTPDPVVTAGPLSVPGELAFGYDHFGGAPYDQAVSAYELVLGDTVHVSACGDIATGPMLFANVPSTPPWAVFLITNWDAPGVALADATVQSFLLVVQSQTLPSSQIGPVGPRGIRLGTAGSTVEAMFPTEAANLNYRSTTVIDFETDAEVVVSERIISVADVDGGPMIIGIVDGVVVTIMWGNPDYVHTRLGRLMCAT